MVEPTTSAPASRSLLGSFNFSNNLVEVGALTALIGSSAAESLVLGNRGAAGVAWAATSSFGTISVVKACFCGANSGWLREILGVRTAASDSAVGLELPSASSWAAKMRKNRNLGEPTAIFVHTSAESSTTSKGAVQWSDVYALDHWASVMLRTIPDTLPGQPLQIFTYTNHPFAPLSTGLQISVILLSASKIAEVYFMRRHNALLLGLVSAVPWAFFFIGALAMQAVDFIQNRRGRTSLGTLDLIAGKLPMVARPGGPRKVVLGAFENPRNSLIWRCFWAIGALVCTASVAFTYIIMADEPRSVVFIWAGFQLLWLAVRILLYHFVDTTVPGGWRMRLGARPWRTLSANLRMRVMDLALSLARFQSEIHPRSREIHARTVDQYIDDSFSNSDLALISELRRHATPEFISPAHPHHTLEFFHRRYPGCIRGHSAIQRNPTPMDLYDSCIVVFAIRDSNNPSAPRRCIAIPSARVLGGASIAESDTEQNVSTFTPRGAHSFGWNTMWWYWIPCQTGLWLQLQVEAGKTLGLHEMEVRSDAQVGALLSSGKLNISIKEVDELRAVVDLARRGREAFLELLS
ncbi:hypothetical protein FB45DRAFT_998920 [Roridomyces roridus]|uniref:Uncharacterized protein n=1 Tax=Roridomyces roridus TaxID=1738132 RepID=A0AAD7CH55_9AGAR|nr:hypothetical protein FB45DRAFT_998920 [Roridomyces roridus]